MRIDLQCTPKSFRCSRVVAPVHGVRGLLQVGVELYFLAGWRRRAARSLRLSRHTMHDKQPNCTGSRDRPGAHLHSHMPNSNPRADGCTFWSATLSFSTDFSTTCIIDLCLCENCFPCGHFPW